MVTAKPAGISICGVGAEAGPHTQTTTSVLAVIRTPFVGSGRSSIVAKPLGRCPSLESRFPARRSRRSLMGFPMAARCPRSRHRWHPDHTRPRVNRRRCSSGRRSRPTDSCPQRQGRRHHLHRGRARPIRRNRCRSPHRTDAGSRAGHSRGRPRRGPRRSLRSLPQRHRRSRGLHCRRACPAEGRRWYRGIPNRASRGYLRRRWYGPAHPLPAKTEFST